MNVENFTENGKCSDCGECCGDFLPMLPGEVKRIKDYVRQHEIKEQRHTVPSANFDLTCPFRDSHNKKCLIYPVRPAICRRFICNRNEGDMKRTRDELHRRGTIVAMRYEFFGNREDAVFLNKLFKSANIKYKESIGI